MNVMHLVVGPQVVDIIMNFMTSIFFSTKRSGKFNPNVQAVLGNGISEFFTEWFKFRINTQMMPI